MKKNVKIILIFAAACSAAYSVIKSAAEKEAKEACKKDAKQEFEDTNVRYAEYEIGEGEKILQDEKKAVDDMMTDWDKENHYRSQIKHFQKEADKAIRMLEIDPDCPENCRLKELEEKRKIALAASKKALGYVKAEHDRDKTVRDAKEKYERQVEYLNGNTDGSPELNSLASNLRFTAEKERDKAIEEANKKFNATKAKYDAKVAEWDEKILDAKTVREEMLAEGRKRILANRDKQMELATKSRLDAQKDAYKTVTGNRTLEQQEILDHYETNRDFIASRNNEYMAAYKQRYKDLSTAEKLSGYFVRHKIGPGMVVFFGSFPLAGLGLIGWEYIKFVKSITDGMKKE